MDTQMKDLIKKLYFEEYLEYKKAEKIFRIEKLPSEIKNRYLRYSVDVTHYEIDDSLSMTFKDIENKKNKRIFCTSKSRKLDLNGSEFYEVIIEIIEIVPFDTIYLEVYSKIGMIHYHTKEFSEFRLFAKDKEKIEFIKQYLED